MCGGGRLPLEVSSEAGRPCVGRGAEGGGIPEELDASGGTGCGRWGASGPAVRYLWTFPPLPSALRSLTLDRDFCNFR